MGDNQVLDCSSVNRIGDGGLIPSAITLPFQLTSYVQVWLKKLSYSVKHDQEIICQTARLVGWNGLKSLAAFSALRMLKEEP